MSGHALTDEQIQATARSIREEEALEARQANIGVELDKFLETEMGTDLVHVFVYPHRPDTLIGVVNSAFSQRRKHFHRGERVFISVHPDSWGNVTLRD